MHSYIAIAIAILVTVVIGVTLFMGPKDSVQASVTDVMKSTTTQIQELIP